MKAGQWPAFMLLKSISFCKSITAVNVTFLSLNKKVTKEVSQRGASKRRPLWKPPPLRRPTPENVPIFGSLQGGKLQVF